MNYENILGNEYDFITANTKEELLIRYLENLGLEELLEDLKYEDDIKKLNRYKYEVEDSYREDETKYCYNCETGEPLISCAEEYANYEDTLLDFELNEYDFNDKQEILEDKYGAENIKIIEGKYEYEGTPRECCEDIILEEIEEHIKCDYEDYIYYDNTLDTWQMCTDFGLALEYRAILVLKNAIEN